MAKRTIFFQKIPWLGGLNTTLDPALVPTDQLVIADNVLFALDGARRKRGGFQFFDTSAIGIDVTIVGLADYFANIVNAKVEKIVAITDEPVIYAYDTSGVRTPLTGDGGSTPLIAGFTQVSMEVMNNDLIMAFNNATTPKKWDNQVGAQWTDLGGSPPKFSICRPHKSRLFAAGVPTEPDRLHYSSIDNTDEWNGAGTSGAIDLPIGDNDPEGITAIFPTIKGQLFVAKRTKLYRINTSDPDDTNWTVEPISNGIGCIAHNNAQAIDQDDVFFTSEKGVHSLAATDKFGDFDSTFLSAPIQKSWNSFNRGRLKQMWAVYIPEKNSYAIALTEEGQETNSHIYLYNVELKQWYRWPLIDCQSMVAAKFGGTTTLLTGRSDGRIARLDNVVFNDFGTAIRFNVLTGSIYPDGSPITVKGFKKLSLFYKPKGNYTLTARFRIDNYAFQELSYSLSGDSDLLGIDFILGASVLGFNLALPVVTQSVDGYGHGFTLELIQDGPDQDVEVYGFAVEYEPAGDDQESPELS